MKYIFVIFSSLLFTNFFGATTISNTILLSSLFPFIIMEIGKESVFKPYIIVVLIGLFFNMISCYYFREQSIFDSFKASVIFYYIMFYFMLRIINSSIDQMESSLFILVIILCGCYIVQYLIYPRVIFSGAEEEYFDDVRIRLVGQSFSSLGYFFGLNNLLIGKRKISNLFLTLLCFGVILLMGFRTMSAGILFFTFILLIRVYGFSWKNFAIGLLSVGIFIAIIQLPVFADKINYMLQKQETQNLSNPNYIRVIQFQYFTQYHFHNILEYILGSGIPFEGTNYSKYMSSLNNEGIFAEDWGLLGLSWLIGIIPVTFMIFYSIKAFILKVDKQYYYIGIWFLYLVTTSITTAEFFRPGNFVVQAIALYMVERLYQTYKQSLYSNEATSIKFGNNPEKRIIFKNQS
jgi:hypothetical protein